MRTQLLCALLAAACVPGAAYGDAEPLPTGHVCAGGFAPTTPARDHWAGFVYSRPVAAASLGDVGANAVSVTVTCDIYYRAFEQAPQFVTSTSGSGTAVATVVPATFSVATAVETLPHIYGCATAVLTDAHGETTTYYLRDDNAMWQTTPDCDGFRCLAFSPNCSYEYALVVWLEERLP